MQSRLIKTLNRLHAAILGVPTTDNSSNQTAQEGQERACNLQRLPTLTARPTEPPEARIIIPLERFATAESIRAGRYLSSGAIRLWDFMHSLAVRYAVQKGFSHAASWATLALPQRIVAAVLGYTDRHVRRLQSELETAGLIATHALAADVDGQNLWATTLWAVKLTTASVTPRLNPDDYAHNWRDFAADLKRKNTAVAVMSGLQILEETKKIFVVFQIIVTGVFSLKPRYLSFSADISPGGVQDAIFRLGTLADSPGPGDVAILAATLSHGLADSHSFRWWCGRLWSVVGSWERIGQLQAQLSRVLVDLGEHPNIKNPGAWANARIAN